MTTLENIKSWLINDELRCATVRNVQTLENCLRHIVLAAECITAMQGYLPGLELAVYVDGESQRLRRKYSVFRFHPERGEIELLVYLHGQGPGSHWAAGLQAGDSVWFRGFTGRITLDTQAATHWFLGDETTLAPFAAIAAAAGSRCEGVIEGNGKVQALLETLWLPFTSVPRKPGSDSRLIGIARTLDLPEVNTTIYVAGAARTVAAVNYVLLHERGIDADRVRRKNFWGDKRR